MKLKISCYDNKLPTNENNAIGAVLIAVADPERGFTAACFLRRDKDGRCWKECEYLFRVRESVTLDEEKVVFQKNNMYSALEFWQDALLCESDVIVMSDVPVEHFSREIRVILHQLKLRRMSRNVPGCMHLVSSSKNPLVSVSPYQRRESDPTEGDTGDYFYLPSLYGERNSNQIPTQNESCIAILHKCQFIAKALCTGNIETFKDILITDPINIQKVTRI